MGMAPAIWVPFAVAVLTGALTWATLIIKLMWQFRGKWDDTNSQLGMLTREVSELRADDTRIEQRLERHLAWHDKH